jgi:hypothetical protein
VVPQRIFVRADWLRRLLQTFTQMSNIELKLPDELPSIDEAAEFMMDKMAGGEF